MDNYIILHLFLLFININIFIFIKSYSSIIKNLREDFPAVTLFLISAPIVNIIPILLLLIDFRKKYFIRYINNYRARREWKIINEMIKNGELDPIDPLGEENWEEEKLKSFYPRRMRSSGESGESGSSGISGTSGETGSIGFSDRYRQRFFE